MTVYLFFHYLPLLAFIVILMLALLFSWFCSHLVSQVHHLNRREDTPPETYEAPLPFHPSLMTHWVGDSSEKIFAVGTNNDGTSRLYRSTNYGRTFKDETSKLTRNSVTISNFHPSPHDKLHVVIVDSKNSNIYMTSDAGESFERLHLDFSLRLTKFNPLVEDMLFAYESESGNLYLRLSIDRGVSWSKRLVDSHGNECQVDNVFWSQSAWHPSDKNDTLYASCITTTSLQILKIPSVLEVIQEKTQPVQIKGTDITPMFDTLIPKSFGLAKEYLFVSALENDDDDTDHEDHKILLVSTDRSSFSPTVLPSNVGHTLDYRIIDASEDQIFLAILHTNSCNVYISDESGLEFVLSLEDVAAHTETNKNGGTSLVAVDFARVEAIDGIYLANKVNGSRVQTLITFDKGAEWEHILSPLDATGCHPPDCSLHLAMNTLYRDLRFQFDPIYSTTSAPGFIMANGNTGDRLNVAPSSFLSIDAGLSWISVDNRPREFVSVDHGGVLVAAMPFGSQTSATKSLLYSIDEGRSWIPFQFTSNNVYVVRLLTEPGEESTVVSVWAVHPDFSKGWLIISIDFANVLGKSCEDSDYTTWSPRDINSRVGCLLGSRQVFQRRKATSKCLNTRNFDRWTEIYTCPCYSNDFECEKGFQRIEDEVNICLPIDDSVSLAPACTYRGQVISISRGYRKVSGDRCKGGLEQAFQPTNYVCPDPCPVTEWSEWSPCDICHGMITTRTRHMLNPNQPRDFCGALDEVKPCEVPNFKDIVSVYPPIIRTRVNESIILSALIKNISIACVGNSNASPYVTLSWKIFDSNDEVMRLGSAFVHADNGLPFDMNKDVLYNFKFIQPGQYKTQFTIRYLA